MAAQTKNDRPRVVTPRQLAQEAADARAEAWTAQQRLEQLERLDGENQHAREEAIQAAELLAERANRAIQGLDTKLDAAFLRIKALVLLAGTPRVLVPDDALTEVAGYGLIERREDGGYVYEIVRPPEPRAVATERATEEPEQAEDAPAEAGE